MESQNALMVVVAVLIATVTYQAMLNPSSGISSVENRRSRINRNVLKRVIAPGEAVMARNFFCIHCF